MNLTWTRRALRQGHTITLRAVGVQGSLVVARAQCDPRGGGGIRGVPATTPEAALESLEWALRESAALEANVR